MNRGADMVLNAVGWNASVWASRSLRLRRVTPPSFGLDRIFLFASAMMAASESQAQAA